MTSLARWWDDAARLCSVGFKRGRHRARTTATRSGRRRSRWARTRWRRRNTATEGAIVIVVVCGNCWCNGWHCLTAARWASTRFSSKCAAGRREWWASTERGEGATGAGIVIRRPPARLPPFVNDEGVEGCESRERRESRIDNEEDLRCVFRSTARISGPAGGKPRENEEPKEVFWVAALWEDVFFPEHAPHLAHNDQACAKGLAESTNFGRRCRVGAGELVYDVPCVRHEIGTSMMKVALVVVVAVLHGGHYGRGVGWEVLMCGVVCWVGCW